MEEENVKRWTHGIKFFGCYGIKKQENGNYIGSFMAKDMAVA